MPHHIRYRCLNSITPTSQIGLPLASSSRHRAAKLAIETMTKDWTRYKAEIETLYITTGKSLDEVRRILKGKRGFDASVRAYRMKLEEWGIRKNTSSKGQGSRVPCQTSKKKSVRSRRSVDATLVRTAVGDPARERSLQTTSLLQPHTRVDSGWTEEFDCSVGNGQSQNDYGPAAPTSFGEHLIDMHLDPDVNINYTTPQSLILHEAILRCTEVEVSNLLSSGMSVNTRDRLNNLPLHTAILRREISIVEVLLNYGADVNAAGFKEQAPIHMAVGSKRLMQLLLRHQSDLSAQDDEGNTALHLLVRMDEWWSNGDASETIDFLLSSGADINIINRSGESPLHQLVTHLRPGSEVYLNKLLAFLDYDPDVTLPTRNGSLLFACFLEKSLNNITTNNRVYGRGAQVLSIFRCLKRFLLLGVDPNTIIRGMPLLNYCLERVDIREDHASWEFLALLLQKADPELPGPGGNYPLHCALARDTSAWTGGSRFPSLKIATELISRKVNVNRINMASVSPLEMWMKRSWRSNYVDCATILIQSGAVTTRLTSTGNTLFDLLKYKSKAKRTTLTKMFLETAFVSQPDSIDVIPNPAWVKLWFSACKEQNWHLAKDRLADLERCDFRPSSTDFDVIAFAVLAERLLGTHKSQLELWQAGNLDQDDARNHRQEYCTILRDCRERKAEVDVSWYKYLLDIMDIS